eukprot:m.326374 g.326374  ORF g.326374 m.326374 type:complete len:1265 (-) comp16480_c0_seq3:181-3975(-)
MGCSHSKRREASPIDQLAPAKPATRPSKGVEPGPSNGAPYGSPDDSADAYVAQELAETGARGVRARDLTSPISPTPSEGYIVTTDATPTPNATPRRQTLLSPAILVNADSARAAIATSTSLVSPDVIEEEEVEADSAIGTDDRPSEGHSEHGTAVDGSDPHTEGVHEVHVHHEPSEGVVVSAEDAYGEHRPSLNPQAAIPRGDSLPGELIVDAGPQRVYDPEPEPHQQPLTAAAVAATAEARGDDLNESVESTATDITHFSSENGKDSPTYDFADALHTDPACSLEEAEEPPAGGLTSVEGAAEDAIPEETETPSPDGGALSAAATPAMEEVPSPEGVAADSPPPPPPPEPSAGAVVVVAEASLSPTPNNDGGSTGDESPGKAKRPTLVLTTAAGAAVVAAARTDKPPVPPRKPSLDAKPQVARKPSTDGKPPLPAKPEEEAILRNVKPSMRKRFSKFGRKRSSATSPDKSLSKDKRSSQGPPDAAPTADVAGSPGKGGGASGATGPEAVDSSPARANTEAESGRAMAPSVDAHGNAIPEWRVSILQQRLDRQSQAGAGDTGVMSPQGSPPKGVRPSSFAVSGLGSAPRSGTTTNQQHSPSGGAAQSPHSAGPRSSAAGGAKPADAASSTTPTANSGSDSATKPRISGPKPPLPPRTSLTTDGPTISAAGGGAHPRFSAGSRGGDVVVARGGVRASGPRTSVISADPPTTPDAPPSWVTRSSDRFPLRKSAGGGATTEADGSSTPSTAGPNKTWAPNSAPATAGGRRSELPKPRTSGGGDASADAPGPARAVTPEWKREMRQWRSTDASGKSKPGGATDGVTTMGAGPAVVEEKADPSAGPAGPAAIRTSLSGSPGKVVDVKVEDDVVTVTEEIPVVRSSLVALKRWSRPRESPAAESGAKAADKHRRQPSLTDIDTLGPAKKEVGMPVITVRRTSSTKALGLTPNDSPGTAGSPSSSRPSTTPKKLSSPFHAAESRASAATPTGGVSPVKSASVHGTPTQAATGTALLQPSSARKSASLHGTPTAPAGRISSSESTQSPAISGRPFGAVTVAEYDAGLPENDGYEEVQVRAVEAARSMDTYIRTLIEVIEANGKEDKGRPDALLTITFGQLFELTANVFDSLVGIIKTARKYGVVTCAKDQLWQGQDDGEVVGLLKRTHDGIFMNRRRLSAVQRISSKPSASIGGFRSNSIMTEAMNCAVCTKRVYAQEFVAAGDKAYHKACFRCADCNRVLKATDYCNTQGLNYCNSCFNRLVMAAGGAGHE